MPALPFAAPQIRSRRLLLRALGARDREALALHANDLDVARNLTSLAHPFCLDDADTLIAAVQAQSLLGVGCFWAIEDETGLVGSIGLQRAPHTTAPVLGYWLGRAAWGRGYATEACRALLNWRFDASPIGEVHSGYFAENKASARVQAKLGFSVVGRMRASCAATGLTHEHINTELTAQDFRRFSASAVAS